jgi:hypothetical protein
MSAAVNNMFPYTGPPNIFWTEVSEADGTVSIIPVQVTPPGGEPYIGMDTYAETIGHYQDPPFDTELDQQAIESGIFDVKPEGFVQEWEGPWLPDVGQLGPPMTTPLAGGHAAAIVFDPLSEFGVGREPAFREAHWEVDQSPNEYFRMGQNMRFGGKPLDDAVNPQAVLYEDIQDQSPTEYQLSWRAFRNLGGGRHNTVVPFPQLGSDTQNLSAVPNVTSLNDLMPQTTDAY